MPETLTIQQTGKISVWMSLLVKKGERDSGMFCSVNIVSMETNSFCIEWEYCFDCPGYTAGGVHHDCIFKKYDNCAAGSRDLIFTIDSDDPDNLITFKGKVGYTHKDNNKELVRIVITSISEEGLAVLRKHIPSSS